MHIQFPKFNFIPLVNKHYVHCKCETVTILVFSCVSVQAVLQLSFQLLVVGPITSCSCCTSLRCNGSNYQYLKWQLKYSWNCPTTKDLNSHSFKLAVMINAIGQFRFWLGKISMHPPVQIHFRFVTSMFLCDSLGGLNHI